MTPGAVLARFDVAQITIYVFWLFFASLIWYLRREDHREGYPLVADFAGQPTPLDTPAMPAAKAFLMGDGSVILAPRAEAPETFAGVPAQPWPGAPFVPTGDPMIDGFGTAAYANRSDHAELAYDDGLPKIVPLRSAEGFYLSTEDPDPRGYTVFGADGIIAGTIVDTWIDRSEYIARFLEVETTPAFGARRVLLPLHFAKIRAKQGSIHTGAILAAQFATVPGLKYPDSITAREEDRITAYYAGGYMYATPERSGPLL